jgi:hypothetical protein
VNRNGHNIVVYLKNDGWHVHITHRATGESHFVTEVFKTEDEAKDAAFTSLEALMKRSR